MKKTEKLAQAFPEFESPWQMARAAYKYTTCGAWCSFILTNGKRLDEKQLPGNWNNDKMRRLSMIQVGSIVEGVDECTDTHTVTVNLWDTPESLADAYWKALEAVEHEADEIWKRTHGCKCCIPKEWRQHYEQGNTPINPKCRSCKGHGIII